MKRAKKIFRKITCNHDWRRDGQTMMSIRWTCAKCEKSMMKGIEL